MFMHVEEVKALVISSLQRLVVQCQVPTDPEAQLPAVINKGRSRDTFISKLTVELNRKGLVKDGLV